MHIIPVILSGGSGTRLWPLSRQAYPKHLLPLTGSKTLIQQTVERASSIKDVSPPIIVCNNEHRFLVAEQLRQIGIDPLEIILEPVGRNTAPAIAVAAIRAISEDPESLLLVMPADHLLDDIENFQDRVNKAIPFAEKGLLMTFGVKPTYPETGYGYIKIGENIGEKVSRVGRFVEKPNLTTARQYMDERGYFWNSGMFFFSAAAYLEEIGLHEPTILEACQESYKKARRDLDFLRLDKSSFEKCPANSIDYAVMEKTDKCAVVELECNWNDIGSWKSLWDVLDKDVNRNVCIGDVITEGVKNSYINSSKRLIAALGLEDVVIVETSDAVLVANKERSQDIKKIVTKLKDAGREEHLTHSKVYRPWGSYEGLVSGDRFQVKLITVKPGAKLSVQMHHHRAEHWIIVKGTARVRRGDETILLTENQSTFIPLGTIHSLENPGKIPLELIEVQSGSYLGEDDIVRLEDIYGRTDQ